MPHLKKLHQKFIRKCPPRKRTFGNLNPHVVFFTFFFLVKWIYCNAKSIAVMVFFYIDDWFWVHHISLKGEISEHWIVKSKELFCHFIYKINLIQLHFFQSVQWKSFNNRELHWITLEREYYNGERFWSYIAIGIAIWDIIITLLILTLCVMMPGDRIKRFFFRDLSQQMQLNYWENIKK